MYINPMVPHNIIFGGLGHTTTAGRKLIFYVDLERERARESCEDEIIEEQGKGGTLTRERGIYPIHIYAPNNRAISF